LCVGHFGTTEQNVVAALQRCDFALDSSERGKKTDMDDMSAFAFAFVVRE
jgi:hypothetical protein